MAEWSKATVLKTVGPFGSRGFESHPLRGRPMKLGGLEFPAAPLGSFETPDGIPFRGRPMDRLRWFDEITGLNGLVEASVG